MSDTNKPAPVAEPASEPEHGELHPGHARSTARSALGYVSAFDGRGINWQSDDPWPHRMELAQALDWITELSAMVLNLADRVVAPAPAVDERTPDSDSVHLAAASNGSTGGAWVPVTERMPASGVTVLACYTNSAGNVRRIRAEWAAAKTIESDAESEISEYDEATDCFYDPEGWYEKIDNWGDFRSVVVVEGEVTYWMPLPAPPQLNLGADGQMKKD